MRNAGKIAILCAAVVSLSAASGCKKKFDPNDFDAGAGATAASAAASTTAPAIDSSAATTVAATDAGDGLAPLETGKAHVAAATGGGGGGGATKPKADPPECVQARKFCNELPPAERGKAANQKACTDNRFACFNKGGHL